MEEKRVEISEALDIVEQEPFVGEEGAAKEQFDKFQSDLSECVHWLKGKNIEKKGVRDTLSKKVRKVVARYFNMEFYMVGQVYVVKDGNNYLVKLHHEGEFLTLIRMHVNELKEPPK